MNKTNTPIPSRREYGNYRQLTGPVLLLLLIQSSLAAQLLYVQTPDGVYIGQGTSLVIQGGVEIGRPGVEGWLQVEGDLVVGSGQDPIPGLSDWKVQNNIHGGTEGSGRVILASGHQHISGTVAPVFPQLILAAVDQHYTLEVTTRIKDALRLGAGNQLLLGSQELQLLFDEPDSLNADGGGWIISESNPYGGADYGTVYWETGAADTSVWYAIPFGVASQDLSLAFSGSPDPDAWFQSATYGTGMDNLPLPSVGRGLTDPVLNLYSSSEGGDNSAFTIDRYWVVNPGAPNRRLRFRYRSGENSGGIPGEEAQLRAQVWTSGAWQYPAIGWSEWPAEFVVQSPVSQTGVWALTLDAHPLPISCAGFQAISQENRIVLQWSLEEARNRAVCRIERSSDGVHWSEQVILPVPESISSGVFTMQWVDHHPPREGAYYRLSGVQENGNAEQWCSVIFSRPLLPELSDALPWYWPNPAREQVAVQWLDDAPEITSAHWVLPTGQQIPFGVAVGYSQGQSVSTLSLKTGSLPRGYGHVQLTGERYGKPYSVTLPMLLQ